VILDFRYRVWSLGLMVKGLWIGGYGLWLRVTDLGLRVEGSRLRV
jgi:hypothetical protein